MTRRTALITGAAGQDGTLLTEFLTSQQGYRVVALVRGEGRTTDRLRRAAPGVEVAVGDLTSTSDLQRIVAASEPDEVYNLAGFSSVGRSWSEVETVMRVNTQAVAGLLEVLREWQYGTGRAVRFYQASSSEMFGAPRTSPQTVDTAMHPRSPYGVSKAAAHHLTINYRESYGLFACSGILYNHESPLRSTDFVTAKIAHAAAMISRGRADALTLGSIDVRRDWGWAPDYVRAMWLMLQHDVAEDFVIATGVSHSLEDFIGAAFQHVGIADWHAYVQHDPGLVRPVEVAGLVGDPGPARDVLGWEASVRFPEMVGRLVDAHLAAATCHDRLGGTDG